MSNKNKEHRWPVPVASLTDGSVGSVLWRHRGKTHLTVAVKATFAIGSNGELQAPLPTTVVPLDLPSGQPSELSPLLSRAEVHLRARREGTFHLAVYQDQECLANKSGAASAFAPVLATDARRRPAMESIERGVMLAIPDDFPWHALQAAPKDQQLERLVGSEWIMVGATGDAEAMRVHLPGLAASVKIYGLAEAQPVPTPYLDMVLIDLDDMRCSLIWRTHFEVQQASALLTLTAVAAAVHAHGQPFDFPSQVPPASIKKSCPLPGMDDASDSPKKSKGRASALSGLNMTMGPAGAAAPALPFAGQTKDPPSDAGGNSPDAGGNSPDAGGNSPDAGGNSPDAGGTVDIIELDVGARKAALRMTLGTAGKADRPALPFAGGPKTASPHVAVGSAGAPWEAPVGAVPQVVSTPDASPDRLLDTANVTSPESTLGEGDTQSAVIPPAVRATPFATPTGAQAGENKHVKPLPGAPWASKASGGFASPPGAPASAPPAPASAPAPAHASAPPAQVAASARVSAPPAPVASAPAPPAAVATPSSPGGTPSRVAPSYRNAAAAAAAEEQAKKARAAARAQRLREHQREMKTLRQELEAAAADDNAARLAEEQRAEADRRAEVQRQRENTERAEAERMRERQADREAKRKQSARMRDVLYGFRTK